MSDPDAARRYNVRTLLPGPDSGVRDALTWAGAPAGSMALVARHAAVEAIAVEGLRSDETRVLERMVTRGGGVLLTDPAGSRGVILAPLSAAGELAQALRDWGPGTEALGDALGAALTVRLTPPPSLELARTVVTFDGAARIIAERGGPDIIEPAAHGATPFYRAVATAGEAASVVAAGGLAALPIAVAGELWPMLTSTLPGAVVLVAGPGLAVADACAGLRRTLAAAAAAGVPRERIWFEVAVTGDVLADLVQYRCVGVALVADVTAFSGGAAAAAATLAARAGAGVIRAADAGDVREALALVAALTR